jgi:hypothetical protein
MAMMAFFCQSIAVGFSPQRKASIRQTLKRPAMAMMAFFCQSIAVGFSPQRKASGYGSVDGVFCQLVAVGFSPQRETPYQ